MAQKFLDATGVGYIASLLDNYPDNEILGTVITAIQSALDEKQDTYTAITATLPLANWSSNSQTVTATGATSSNLIQVSPSPSSATAWASAGVLCSAQGTNVLTFTCSSVPATTLTANIVIWNEVESE